MTSTAIEDAVVIVKEKKEKEKDSFPIMKESDADADGDADGDGDGDGDAQLEENAQGSGSGSVEPPLSKDFLPNLEHSNSLVLSEIDSDQDQDEDQDEDEPRLIEDASAARNVGEIPDLATSSVDNVQVPEKKIDNVGTDEVQSEQHLRTAQHGEEVLRARVLPNEIPDGSIRKDYNSQPKQQHHFQQQPEIIAPPRIQTQSPYMDGNTPLVMVPSVSQHLLIQQQMQQMQQIQQMQGQIQMNQHQANQNGALSPMMYSHHSNPMLVAPQPQPPAQPSRRKMKLRLSEEMETIEPPPSESLQRSKRSIFSRVAILGRPKSRSVGSSNDMPPAADDQSIPNSPAVGDGLPRKLRFTEDRGDVTVSWYDGTSAVDLRDHVRKSVEIKLGLGSKKLLLNVRLLDESVEPNEEIVLSPYIPDGSKFLLMFRVKDLAKKRLHRAPHSPSAAPSPPGELERELKKQLIDVLSTEKSSRRGTSLPNLPGLHEPEVSTPNRSNTSIRIEPRKIGSASKADRAENGTSGMNGVPQAAPQPDDILSERLEKLNETLLLLHEDGTWAKEDPDPHYVKTEKKHTIFVIANYFVLFLSLIAISAEIHENAPFWIGWIDENVTSVQSCSADKDALFKCVSEGNFSGLVASVILWASQSVVTKRFFLFGFDSPKKLWTVVYEGVITALCWGTSYLAIRRGLNPDTRSDWLRKYWKDAVYGSLAGFNAAFMKAVLKNLLPQADEVLDVLETRQIGIVKFLGRVFKGESIGA